MRQFRSVPILVFLLALPAALLGMPSGASAQSGSDGSRIWMTLVFAPLGAEVRDVTPADATSAKAAPGKGAFVVDVREGGAASKAGIKAGDVILEFDGEQVRSAAMLRRLVNETPANRAVKVVVMREGKRLELTATIEEREQSPFLNSPGLDGRNFTIRPPILRLPSPDDQWQTPPPGQSTPRFRVPPGSPRFAPPLWQYDGGPQLGITVQELTPQLGEYFGVPNGVLVASVAADSAAARANLKAGDVVTMLDKIVVRTADDLRRLLDERHVGDRVMLSIVRNRKPMTVTVTLESARTRVRPI